MTDKDTCEEIVRKYVAGKFVKETICGDPVVGFLSGLALCLRHRDSRWRGSGAAIHVSGVERIDPVERYQ